MVDACIRSPFFFFYHPSRKVPHDPIISLSRIVVTVPFALIPRFLRTVAKHTVHESYAKNNGTKMNAGENVSGRSAKRAVNPSEMNIRRVGSPRSLSRVCFNLVKTRLLH